MAVYTMRRKMLLLSRAALFGLFLLIAVYAVPNMMANKNVTFLHTSEMNFNTKVIASELSDPWDMTEGPDGKLWVTESKSYRVIQIDTATGEKTVVLDLKDRKTFPAPQPGRETIPWPQGGLMGIALHPQLAGDKPFVYVAYVYKHLQGNRFQARLERYKYNRSLNTLGEPRAICDTIPASNDHNGGRITIANVKGQPYLFYTVGDMGSGQFSNGGTPNNAQNKGSYEGKILRYSLEPRENTNDEQVWIPLDNPFNNTIRSAVWSVGHRNPQGLAAATINGKEYLYSSEHGPYSDDEINLIEKGKNYGHPLVIGYNDGNYNGLAASVSTNSSYPGKWHTTYPFIKSEQVNADSIGTNYRDPIKSFYPTSNSRLNALFSAVQRDEKAGWDAWAPSGITVYTGSGIPGWKNSILVATLKGGTLLRLPLKNNGQVANDIFEYEKGKVRYRDVEVGRDAATIYLATDSSSVTSGPSASNPKSTNCRGCIIRLRYAAGTAK
jgi:PQQ-dependent dehydrogenase (s-GDH family)